MATVNLISHSSIPVLEETLSSHFPLTSTGCTQNSISEEETVLVTLPHNEHKSLADHTAVIKDEQSAWALQGLLTEPTQSSCKAKATQIAKRTLQHSEMKIGHPPTVLQTAAAALSNAHSWHSLHLQKC